jgi:hypothetical protein
MSILKVREMDRWLDFWNLMVCLALFPGGMKLILGI